MQSWTIDGEEVIGFTVSSFDMEYEKQTAISGETEWDIVGSRVLNLESDYEIESNGTEIDIDGDDLELTGTVELERWIIQAERD